MKKLNNKGVTLIELIVSFAIVSVAVIYLYQTLFIVSKLYTDSKNATNNYIDVDYAFRIIDAWYDKYGNFNDIANYNTKDSYFKANKVAVSQSISGYDSIQFEVGSKNYFIYKKVKSVVDSGNAPVGGIIDNSCDNYYKQGKKANSDMLSNDILCYYKENIQKYSNGEHKIGKSDDTSIGNSQEFGNDFVNYMKYSNLQSFEFKFESFKQYNVNKCIFLFPKLYNSLNKISEFLNLKSDPDYSTIDGMYYFLFRIKAEDTIVKKEYTIVKKEYTIVKLDLRN